MAKLNPVNGKMTGKLSGTVYSVRGGEQIVREYSGTISNPSTPAQVAQRAKFKLLSQLGEIMSSALMLPEVRNVSSRNQFMKLNMPSVAYVEALDKAEIDWAAVKLTSGILYMPNITAIERTAGRISAGIQGAQGTSPYDVVVYAAYALLGDHLRLGEVKSINTAGASGDYAVNMAMPGTGAGIIYAYGIVFNDEKVRVRYNNIIAEQGDASLSVIKSILTANSSVTETAYAAVPAVTHANMAKKKGTE